MKPKHIAFLLVLCGLAGATSARADEIVLITGSVTCSYGSPIFSDACAQQGPGANFFGSFSESFEFDETTISIVPNTMSVASTGNLGTFGNPIIVDGLQFNWFDQFGNMVQLDFSNELPFVSVPNIGEPGDFWIDGFPYPPGFGGSTSDVEPVATPEPATILCLLAAFAVALMACPLANQRFASRRASSAT